MSSRNESSHQLEVNVNQLNAAESDDARAEACPRTDGDREAVAVPSNTATNNSIENEIKDKNKEIVREEEYKIKFLRWGIDSLYLSYQGNLHSDIHLELQRLKTLAQSESKDQQALAQHVIDDHIFEVKDKGSSFFTYILEDNAFRISLSKPDKAVPMAYVKISSEYLTYKQPADAEKVLKQLLDQMGLIESGANTSRLDAYLDFACDLPMDAWPREAWVTRAAAIHQYSVDQQFTGWAIGQGSDISARLYNKTIEIMSSDKGYMIPLWKQVGWDGVTPVLRLEFQFKRSFLDQKGIISLSAALEHLNGLWSYATTEWLKLTIPNKADQTRSRWPIHPLWLDLSGVDWETQGGPLKSRFENQRTPKNSAILRRVSSGLFSWMAANQHTEFDDAIHAFVVALQTHLETEADSCGVMLDTFVNKKVAIKARQFNTLVNLPDDDPFDETEAYRKASDGE